MTGVVRAPGERTTGVLAVLLLMSLVAAGALGWAWWEAEEDLARAREDLAEAREEEAALRNATGATEMHLREAAASHLSAAAWALRSKVEGGADIPPVDLEGNLRFAEEELGKAIELLIVPGNGTDRASLQALGGTHTMVHRVRVAVAEDVWTESDVFPPMNRVHARLLDLRSGLLTGNASPAAGPLVVAVEDLHRDVDADLQEARFDRVDMTRVHVVGTDEDPRVEVTVAGPLPTPLPPDHWDLEVCTYSEPGPGPERVCLYSHPTSVGDLGEGLNTGNLTRVNATTVQLDVPSGRASGFTLFVTTRLGAEAFRASDRCSLQIANETACVEPRGDPRWCLQGTPPPGRCRSDRVDVRLAFDPDRDALRNGTIAGRALLTNVGEPTYVVAPGTDPSPFHAEVVDLGSGDPAERYGSVFGPPNWTTEDLDMLFADPQEAAGTLVDGGFLLEPNRTYEITLVYRVEGDLPSSVGSVPVFEGEVRARPILLTT